MKKDKFEIFCMSANGRDFTITKPFYYEYKGELLVAPEGFVTDFASIPRIFWNIYPPTGIYMPAALLHDVYYSAELKSSLPYASGFSAREWCDRMFYDVMKDCGCTWFTRSLMYRAVRDWGWIVWNRHDRSEGGEVERIRRMIRGTL